MILVMMTAGTPDDGSFLAGRSETGSGRLSKMMPEHGHYMRYNVRSTD